MNDTALWVIAGGGSGVIAFITFWMTMATRMASSQALAETADNRAKNAEHMATVSIAKIEVMNRDVTADRVDMARQISALEAVTRTTSASLAQSETRLAKSIEDISIKIDRLFHTLISSPRARHDLDSERE